MRGIGSRYAPAAPGALLGEVADGDRQIAFVGKPCDVASAKKAMKADPRLSANLAATISIFCAGTPARNGTDDLLRRLGVPNGASVTDIRYRGKGWPGEMQARFKTPDGAEVESTGLSYSDG